MGERRRWPAVGALGLVMLFSACMGAPGGPSPGPTSGGAPTGEIQGLSAYQRRCASLDSTLADARVVFEADKTMTRGESSALAAAVTLDQRTPADEVLHRTGAAEESGFLVSCRVQARLRASAYDFDVSESGWVDRSLVTTDTARWSWYVTPKVGGDRTLVVQVRPILQMQDQDTALVTSEDLEGNIQEFETRAHVRVPWTERPQETMSRLAKTFQVAESLVQAVTLLVLAIGGLLTALGVKKWLKRRQSPA